MFRIRIFLVQILAVLITITFRLVVGSNVPRADHIAADETRSALREKVARMSASVSQSRDHLDSRNQRIKERSENLHNMVQELAERNNNAKNKVAANEGPARRDLSNSEIEANILNKLNTQERVNHLKTRFDSSTKHVLSKHAVSNSLIQEINRMAASSVPHDSLVLHVKSHYPQQSKEVWNDIVVSALAAQGRVSQVTDFEKSRQGNLAFRQQMYERSRASYEAKKEL